MCCLVCSNVGFESVLFIRMCVVVICLFRCGIVMCLFLCQLLCVLLQCVLYYVAHSDIGIKSMCVMLMCVIVTFCLFAEKLPGDEDGLAKWCQVRWEEKERMLDSYYNDVTEKEQEIQTVTANRRFPNDKVPPLSDRGALLWFCIAGKNASSIY